MTSNELKLSESTTMDSAGSFLAASTIGGAGRAMARLDDGSAGRLSGSATCAVMLPS